MKAVLAFVLFLPLIIRPQSIQLRGAGDTYHTPDARAALALDWWYDWSPRPGDDGVPMIWDASQIGYSLDGDDEWLMGFNEPEGVWQANLTPEQAAVEWRRLEATYPGRKLVSPSVLQLSWLKQWREAYQAEYGQPPKMDALGVHCYVAWEEPADAFRVCRTQLLVAQGYARKWSIGEVWLTEWALITDYPDEACQFMRLMVDWMRTQPRVTRYAWFQTYYRGDEPWAFGGPNTSLWTGTELSELGRMYASFR